MTKQATKGISNNIKSKQQTRQEIIVSSIMFWTLHAEYWRNLKQFVKAGLCDNEVAALKRILRT
jgi:hypothetical protein